jgi:BASS family bile acid:Na+ symporter
MAPIDQVHLSFNPQTLTVLNAVLGLVMFGVALELRVEDFKLALRTPKALALGLAGHHLLFPAMTYGLVWILQPLPSIALGMILVSSCPAGHISNFLVHYSRGNTALSVSVSALSTAAALVMTPLNFAFWGNLHPITSPLMKQVAMSPWEMLQVIVLLLGVPLVLGMWVARRFPAFARRVRQPMKWLSLLVLVGFILGALAANFAHFLAYIQLVLLVVFIHNLLALVTGYTLSAALGLPERDRRAITFEMGIQNSGLGLILIFNFFNGLGGMAIVTAWWGIWHIVAGMSLATFWRGRDPGPAPAVARAATGEAAP